MATAAGDGAPAGPDNRTPPTQDGAMAGAANPVQPDSGPHGSGQDGATAYAQHYVPARPLLYLHAPHPPPFFPYQWPVPFHYHPFTGFPGMGYSVVVPPFPPSSYLEAPAYIMPQHHIQPVDYRRLLHPQVHAASAPYQNRRTRPLHNPPVRQVVNSEVQTEQIRSQRGNSNHLLFEQSPLISSESGRGTTSTSPSCSSSSSQKQGSTDTLPRRNTKDGQVKRTRPSSTINHGFEIPPKPVQAHIKATLEKEKRCEDGVGQENVLPCSNSPCDMWSVCSTDSMLPVCSSSDQEDELTKERCVSFPDILMSWGGGTSPVVFLKNADNVLPQNEAQLPCCDESEAEHESQPETDAQVTADGKDDAKSVLGSKEGETQHKTHKLPSSLQLLESRKANESLGVADSSRKVLPSNDAVIQQEVMHSGNKPYEVTNCGPDERTSPEKTAELIYHQTPQMKRKMNESLWSVESLIPYVPSREWLMQNGMLESDSISEMMEDAENGGQSTQNDKLTVKAIKERRLSRRFSLSSDMCLSSAGCFDQWQNESSSTRHATVGAPAEMGNPGMWLDTEREVYPSSEGQLERGLNIDHSEGYSPDSPSLLQRETHLPTPTEENADKKRSPEPAANQSPNQESVTEQQQKSLQPVETLLFQLDTEEEDKGSSADHGAQTQQEEAAACGHKDAAQLQNKYPAEQNQAAASPSKGHLVDCGVQCSELQERKCSCGDLKNDVGANRTHLARLPDFKKTSGHVNKNYKKQSKNKGQGGSGRILKI
ncbi:hypothetical protein LDENG_00071460 [Lucifuga dentata]|nr:hypothetical protein LDENG_00071460 [Lucifuga dentata]